jgi:hypothetical protein
MVSFLPLLIGVKQFFDVLGNRIANYLRCRSNCCYQVNVYEPKKTVVIGELSNPWRRRTTPTTPEDSFKTPRS